jgi:hypothetical protein
MRMKGTDLKEMIRAIVHEEMRTVVTEVINEVMTERYMKKVVAEALNEQRAPSRAPLALRDLEEDISTQDDEEDDLPAPHRLANTTKGVYDRHPIKKEVREQVARDPRMSMFFEGTKPLDEVEEKYAEGVPLAKPGVVEEAAERWKKVLQATDERAAASRPVSVQDPELIEKRLAARRAALEIPVRS